jgi:hypothetical protein
VTRPTNGARTSFKDKIRNYEKDPSRWEPVSVHTEPSSRKGARQRGLSTQTLHRNRDTGETIWRHTVIDDRGRIEDDHFRPNFKPRMGDM